jgi:endonuclease-3
MARELLNRLPAIYPDAHCELDHSNPLELLVATILSAQCTDKRVNMVTPELFRRWPDPAALAAAAPRDLEAVIRSTGFFRAKAKSILGCARGLVDRHGGEVPRTLEELVRLPGVGRKTANVVLNTAFGEPTIAVDTHIFRVSNRTGLAPGKDVDEVERRLLKFVPDEFRQDAHHWLILHGRYVCKARRPECFRCGIRDWCEYRPKTPSPHKRP